MFPSFKVAVLAALVGYPSLPLSPQDRYSEFDEVIRSTREVSQHTRARQIADTYDQQFSRNSRPTPLNSLPSANVVALFHAASDAAAITKRPSDAKDMATYLAELEARGLANMTKIQDTYGALLETRSFRAAGEFYRLRSPVDWGEMVSLSPTSHRSTTGYELLVIPEHGSELGFSSLDLHKVSQVVVIAHPGCGYTRRAATDIEQDQTMRALFSKHSTWLSAGSRFIGLSDFRTWNREHPDLRMSIAYAPLQWADVDFWDSPTFLFYKEGRLVQRIVGWPTGGRLGELEAAARKAGLLKPPTTGQQGLDGAPALPQAPRTARS